MHASNSSFYKGIVSEQIQITTIVPIYKHGDPSQFNNYKPVSVLNEFSKCMSGYSIEKSQIYAKQKKRFSIMSNVQTHYHFKLDLNGGCINL